MFLLSSPRPPVFLPTPPLSLSLSSSPLHSCCTVSSDLVCQALLSFSLPLVFTLPSPAVAEIADLTGCDIL